MMEPGLVNLDNLGRGKLDRSLATRPSFMNSWRSSGRGQDFYRAAQSGVVPKIYWEAAERWKSVTTKFTRIPVTDPASFYEGKRITWSLAEESPLALIGQQLGWILELIEEARCSKINNASTAGKWYFARFDHQEFCSNECRGKNHSRSDAFRQRRRKYMREYYRSRNSGKTKRGSVSEGN